MEPDRSDDPFARFLANQQTYWGGAIYSRGRLKTRDVVFRGNEALSGSAIYSTGEADIGPGTVFEENFGGPIGPLFAEGELNVDGALFQRNRASSDRFTTTADLFSFATNGVTNTQFLNGDGAEAINLGGRRNSIIENVTVAGFRYELAIEASGSALTLSSSTIAVPNGRAIRCVGSSTGTIFGPGAIKEVALLDVTLTAHEGIVGQECNLTKFNTALDIAPGGECRLRGTISEGSPSLSTVPGCGVDVSPDLRLGALRDNGGGGLTRAPRNDSPLIDAGTACRRRDQIGGDRPLGSGCDIGAVEVR